jgi:uncharacterized protein YciI
MSLFAILAWDAPDAPRLRQEHLAAHLAYAEAQGHRIAVGGPLRDGDAFTGSLLIVEAADRAEAQALLDGDPYYRAGVWARVEVQPFRAVIGTWIGGRTW